MSEEIKEGLVSKIKKFVTAKSRGKAAHERMGKVAGKHLNTWFNSHEQIRSGKRMQGDAAVELVKGGKLSKYAKHDFDRAEKHINFHQGVLDDAGKRIDRINKRRDQVNALTGLKEGLIGKATAAYKLHKRKKALTKDAESNVGIGDYAYDVANKLKHGRKLGLMKTITAVAAGGDHAALKKHAYSFYNKADLQLKQAKGSNLTAGAKKAKSLFGKKALKEERLDEISKKKAERYYFASNFDMTRRIQNQTSDDKHFERKLKNRQDGADTAEGKAWPKMRTNSLYDKKPVKKVKVLAKEEYINTAGDEATKMRRNKKRTMLAKKATVVAEGIISKIKTIKPMKIGTKNTAMDSLRARQSAQTAQLKQRQAQERTQFKINNARKPKPNKNV